MYIYWKHFRKQKKVYSYELIQFIHQFMIFGGFLFFYLPLKMEHQINGSFLESEITRLISLIIYSNCLVFVTFYVGFSWYLGLMQFNCNKCLVMRRSCIVPLYYFKILILILLLKFEQLFSTNYLIMCLFLISGLTGIELYFSLNLPF